jgi:hypothetical protein
MSRYISIDIRPVPSDNTGFLAVKPRPAVGQDFHTAVPGLAEHHIDPFASQFPRNGFANAPTAASHDRMLSLQSEVHVTLSPWRRDRDLIASLLIVLSEGT